MSPLTLEITDSDGQQWRPAFRGLRFTKIFFGGEDLWAVFMLDRTSARDWPDVGYGYEVILRSGLGAKFVGEMREITQDVDEITCKALGNWIYLNDYGYGDQGKLWSDCRYEAWKPVTTVQRAACLPGRFEIDTNNRLEIQARYGETFGNAIAFGDLYYYCPYDLIKRVTFNYNFADPGNWEGHLYSNAGTPAAWGVETSEWSVAATGAGAVNVTFANARALIHFRLFYNAAQAQFWGATGTCYLRIGDLRFYGSTDTTPTASDVAIDVVAQLAAGTPISDDVSLIDPITLTLEPLFYESGETCYKALEDAASFGDVNNQLIGWGIEPGGDRLYMRVPDRDYVRYVVPPEHATRLLARGQVDREFITAGWGQYLDEDGQMQFTDKYYVHVTPTGLEANTTATGDDLASNIYGVQRERVIPFGRTFAPMVTELLKKYLIQHGHPQVKSSCLINGPVQDLDKGGAWIQPYAMEMGYVVQIPHFRAVEAEGVAGVDLREWDTTFLLVGMEYDDDKGQAKLIPEGASEDLERLISYVRLWYEDIQSHIYKKRPTPRQGGVR